jgi:hypothetical protein
MSVLDFIVEYRDIGLGGLLALFVMLVFFGKLVPQSQVQRLLDIWQRAYEISEESRKQQAELMKDSVEAVNTAADVVRSIRDAGSGGKK